MTGGAAPLFVQSEGAGEPVVLLNGIAMTAVSWQAVARPLATRFRVIRCDFRGQLMTPAEPPREVAEHADDLATLLDKLELDSAHVIGTSFGGVVGTLFAARYPGRARSLVTIAAADGFDESMADVVARWRQGCVDALEGGDRGVLSDTLEPVVYSPEWVAAHNAERAQRSAQIAALPDAWFEGLIGLLDSAHSLRIRDVVAAIACPTLVVAAELDAFVPLNRARGLADAIAGSRFEVVKGAGHAVVVEQPRRIADLCLDFLEGMT